jgi:hypothetical protein
VEELKRDNVFDNKIGAYVFEETRTDKSGLQEVYAGCWRAGEELGNYYLGDNDYVLSFFFLYKKGLPFHL